MDGIQGQRADGGFVTQRDYRQQLPFPGSSLIDYQRLFYGLRLEYTNQARLFGLDAGTLKPGARADLAIVDLDEPWLVREADIRSRSKNTCFEGARMQGRVLQTMVAGKTVFQQE